jgi:hypothetical protein
VDRKVLVPLNGGGFVHGELKHEFLREPVRIALRGLV